MSGETPTYATYKEFCGNREQPWVTLCSEAVDWTQQETTRDQVRIEAGACDAVSRTRQRATQKVRHSERVECRGDEANGLDQIRGGHAPARCLLRRRAKSL